MSNFKENFLSLVWNRADAAELAVYNSYEYKDAAAKKRSLFETIETNISHEHLKDMLGEYEDSWSVIIGIIREAAYMQGLRDGVKLERMLESD